MCECLFASQYLCTHISANESELKEDQKQPKQPPPTKESAEPKSITWQPWPGMLSEYSPYPGAWMGLPGSSPHSPFVFNQQAMFLPRDGANSRQPELNVPLNLVQREYTYGDSVFDLSRYLPKDKEWEMLTLLVIQCLEQVNVKTHQHAKLLINLEYFYVNRIPKNII